MRTYLQTRRVLLSVAALLALTLLLVFGVALRNNPRTTVRVGTAVGSGGGPASPAPLPTPVSVPTPAVPRIVPSGTGNVPGSPIPLPATAPLPEPTCATSTTSNQTSLSIAIQNSPIGFSEPCYSAAASQELTVVMQNSAVNPKTVLPIPMAFSVAPSSHPEFRPVAGANGAFSADSSAVVAVSATALDATPITFTLAPLAPGSYVLQLTTAPTAPPAVLTIK